MVKRAKPEIADGQSKGNKRVRMEDEVKGKGKGKGKAGAGEPKQSILKKGKQPEAAAAALVPATAKGKAKAKASLANSLPQEPSVKPATAFEVIAGSYERLLYGLHCSPSGSGPSADVDIQPIFQFPAHLTAVKTAHASPNGRWLATGAADEVIKVWDLRRRKEVGGLLGHEGDITSLTFPSDKYLVSTSADGTLSLFRTKDWSLLRKFKGHKGPVKHAAIHPQGRVALSVGKDRCLRMWDLLGRSTNKSSTSTKLGAEADLVRWNTSGNKIAVLLDREIRIFTIDMALLHTLTSRSRFHDVQFVDVGGTEILLVACEDGKVRLYQSLLDAPASVAEEGEQAQLECFAELVGHENRVKSVSAVSVLGQTIAATISSDGKVNIYSLAAVPTLLMAGEENPEAIEPIASHDTKGSRLTCLAAVGVSGDRTTAGSVLGEAMSDDDLSSDSDSDSELEGDVIGIDEDAVNDSKAAIDGEEDEDEDEEEAEAEVEDDEEEWGGLGDE